MIKKPEIKTPIKVGLTGSIGMGKTTVSNEIVKLKIPVWSADTVVHELYKKTEDGYKIVKKLLPQAATNHEVDRTILADNLMKRPVFLERLEAKLKPLLKKSRETFIEENKLKRLLVFDIPLLFETKADIWLDKIIVVTTSKSTQKKRVMARQGMTKEKFEYINSKQLSNQKKIKKADFVLNTEVEFGILKREIKTLMEKII